MEKYVEVGKLVISDLEFFIEQLQLFLNNPYILKIIGDEHIKIEAPAKLKAPQFALKIIGSVRRDLGEILVKLLESEIIPREKLYLRATIVDKELTFLQEAVTQFGTMFQKETVKLPFVQKTNVYLVHVRFLKILPVEFLEIIKSFLERFTEIPRLLK